MARPLFRDRKRSNYLKRLTASISLERRRCYSRASAMLLECPTWKLQIEASQGMGVSSSSNRGAQVRYGQRTSASRESSLLSTEVSLLCLSLFVFCCFGSFSGAISLSTISFPFLFIFCKFGSGCRPRGEGRRGSCGLGGSWIFGASLDGFVPHSEETFQSFS